MLIVIEGKNGCGKTSIINELIKKNNNRCKLSIVVYKFPDRKGYHGDRIDKYLKNEITIESKYDILDMFAANREHARVQIEKDLKAGKIVICDRYVHSAIAYQVPKTSFSLSTARMYCETIGYFDKYMPRPDIVYLIDGDHLSKREILKSEIFHDAPYDIYGSIKKIVQASGNAYIELENHNGRLCVIVADILHDIETRYRSQV